LTRRRVSGILDDVRLDDADVVPAKAMRDCITTAVARSRVGDSLAVVCELADLEHLAVEALHVAVRRAVVNWPWHVIAAELGVSKQAAQQRFGKKS
jgi:hypothetical protein